MPGKTSLQDQEGVVWQDVPLTLGERGLDLRRPDDPGTMSELLNARFVDSQTFERRGGHRGQLVQDRSFFSQGKRITDEWVYGHGTRLVVVADESVENRHHPVHNRCRGVFAFGDSDVVWTGDRLLVAKSDGAFYGGGLHWDRTPDGTGNSWGVPAYLPVQDDSYPPFAVKSGHVETCLTPSLRIFAATDGNDLLVTVINRETGVTADSRRLAVSNHPTRIRVLNSGGVPVLVWMDDGGLSIAHWNGGGWSSTTVIDPDAETYDVALTDNGFHLVWRDGALITAGRFIGSDPVDTPYTFGKTVPTGTPIPCGYVAVSVNVEGCLALAWQAKTAVGLYTNFYTPELVALGAPYNLSNESWTVDPTSPPPGYGLTCQFRGLRESGTRYYLVHFSTQNAEIDKHTDIYEVSTSGGTVNLDNSKKLRHTSMVSKAFGYGDEVFVWLRAENSKSAYLAAGLSTYPLICGVADREECNVPPQKFSDFADYWMHNVTPDPLADGKFTWIRDYDAGEYFHAGNARIGDIDMLPDFSSAAFGHSMYLAGSMVKNWDGVELGDAGFHDFPIIHGFTGSNTGPGAMPAGTFQFRVYAVRYNKQGERFMSVAVTGSYTLVAPNDTVQVDIRTLPLTNHDDVMFEVYRTEMGQTAFWLDGVVANDRSIPLVSYTCVMSNADLRVRPGDPHAAQIGGLPELEEMAPIGCRTIIAAGDRLWGIGGQTPKGVAQYSKLYENGEGVGFDAIDGEQVLDATGADLTSIAAYNDTTIVAFQRDRLFVITSDGPNNYGQGGFGVPNTVITEGAVNHAGTTVIPEGVLFWAASGPRALGSGLKVENISEPVRQLASRITPSGVRVDKSRSEVVWYSAAGDALLWNYTGGNSRWARWNRLRVAGCSSRKLVTPDGMLLTPSSDEMDAGIRFDFRFATGHLRAEALLEGGALVRRVGLVGEHNGPHNVTFRVYYNGSPDWSERFRWHPEEGTYLTNPVEWATLTPAELDALALTDRSGSYATHRRLQRQECRFFRVDVSDGGDAGFTPWELDLEIGAKAGLGRVARNSFTKG